MASKKKLSWPERIAFVVESASAMWALEMVDARRRRRRGNNNIGGKQTILPTLAPIRTHASPANHFTLTKCVLYCFILHMHPRHPIICTPTVYCPLPTAHCTVTVIMYAQQRFCSKKRRRRRRRRKSPSLHVPRHTPQAQPVPSDQEPHHHRMADQQHQAAL